jgi:Protein of unknown function (DUF3551)
MRKLAIVTVVIAAAALSLVEGTVESHAAEGPRCHMFGGATASIQNCGIQSLEVCRFEIQGNGGSCSPNPRYHGNSPNHRVAPQAGPYPWPWR